MFQLVFFLVILTQTIIILYIVFLNGTNTDSIQIGNG